MGKSTKKLGAICLMVMVWAILFNGSVVPVDGLHEMPANRLNFEVLNAASDTAGPIDISNTKNWSIALDFTSIAATGAFILDSGITIDLRQSWSKSKSTMVTPGTVDSALSIFGSTTITDHATRASKGLTLDAMRYLWVIINRTDTRADSLKLSSNEVIFTAVRRDGIR